MPTRFCESPLDGVANRVRLRPLQNPSLYKEQGAPVAVGRPRTTGSPFANPGAIGSREEIRRGARRPVYHKDCVDSLSEYAAYHRDRRNIAIHGAGIPLIVLSLVILTSRAGLHIGTSVTITLAEVLLTGLTVFYLTLQRTLAIAFALAGVVMILIGNAVVTESFGIWLAAGIGTFVFGWILQFIGHGWEGKKPAFLDDIMGLIIGPLFVTAEAFFAAGALSQLKAAVEERAGPTYIRAATAKA